MNNPESILLVEDNRQDELLILRSLRQVDLASQVDVARDGQQALDYLFQEGEFAGRRGRDLPTLVILDISLPRVSGLEVLARLRAHPRTTLLPVVMLTSSDEEQDLVQAYQNRCNSFVRKPLDFAKFAETVASLGSYWQAMNRAPRG